MKKQKCKTSIISSKLISVEKRIWNTQFQNTFFVILYFPLELKFIYCRHKYFVCPTYQSQTYYKVQSFMFIIHSSSFHHSGMFCILKSTKLTMIRVNTKAIHFRNENSQNLLMLLLHTCVLSKNQFLWPLY